MRKLGTMLMSLGAVVGVGAGAWILFGPSTAGVSWLLSVGLVKLTLVASLGTMAAGAGVTRLAKRAEDRAKLVARGLSDR